MEEENVKLMACDIKKKLAALPPLAVPKLSGNKTYYNSKFWEGGYCLGDISGTYQGGDYWLGERNTKRVGYLTISFYYSDNSLIIPNHPAIPVNS